MIPDVHAGLSGLTTAFRRAAGSPTTRDEIARIDAEIAAGKARKVALAAALADEEIKLDGLRRLFDASPTDELQDQILTGEEGQRRRAMKSAALEKIEDRKLATLRSRRHALRVEALERAEADERAALVRLDREIVQIILDLSPKLSAHMKAEHDILQINARRARLGERPEPTGGLALSEDAILKAFREKFPEASRPMPFGERAAGTYEVNIPVLTPSRVTKAVADDEELERGSE